MLDIFCDTDESLDFILLGILFLFVMAGVFTPRLCRRRLMDCFQFKIYADEYAGDSAPWPAASLLYLCAWSVPAFLFAWNFPSVFPALASWKLREVFLLYYGGFLLYFLLKRALVIIACRIGNRENFGKSINKKSGDYSVLSGFLLAPVVLVGFMLFGQEAEIIFIICAILLIIILLLYFFSCLKIFLAAGVPLYFWILYLCTLEVLPVLTLFRIFMEAKS